MFGNRSKSPINAAEEFDAAEEFRIDGARGEYLDSDRKRRLPAGGRALLVLIIVVALATLIPIMMKRYKHLVEGEKKTATAPIAVAVANPLPKLQLRQPPPPVAKDPEPVQESSPPPTTVASETPAGATPKAKNSGNTSSKSEPNPVDEILLRRLQSPLVSPGSEAASPSGPGASQPAGGPVPYDSSNARGSQAMNSRLESMQIGYSSAYLMQGTGYTITAGTNIDCTLIDRIITSQPGTVTCLIARDVWSADRKTVLIDRGTIAYGFYDADMTQGQTRVFVTWDRLETPEHVFIRVSSPGAGALGEGGLGGHVDNHFGERFGGAILLSLVDDFAAAATQRQSSGNQFNFSNSSSAAQGMADEALKNSVNMAPTLYKNQGERVVIKVARDLYFGDVYELKRR